MKIGIIGAGLFGRIIGGCLSRQGHHVEIFGLKNSGDGLSAAGCLMKPSWMSKIPRRGESLEFMNELWGIGTVPFTVLNKNVVVNDCYVLNKYNLLRDTETLVTLIEQPGATIEHPGTVVYSVGGVERRAKRFHLVIECTGAWSRHATGRYGRSFYVPGATEPKIKPWRPFTQLVKFTMPGGPRARHTTVWAGDGSAYNEWNDEIDEAVEARVMDYLGEDLKNNYEATGYSVLAPRPYSKVKTSLPCNIFTDDRAGVLVVTGGAKNGTIAAAWAALEIGDRLK